LLKVGYTNGARRQGIYTYTVIHWALSLSARIDMGNNRNKTKCKGKKTKKRKNTSVSVEQTLALNFVRDWAFPFSLASGSDPLAASCDFLPSQALSFASSSAPVVFDLHTHSNHSDGYLSPSALVERAYKRGVLLPFSFRLNCFFFYYMYNCLEA
jgi:hypothetical protein